MKRTHQILITSLLTLVFVVSLAPASLIGAALRQASGQQWDVADARGTLWNGQGTPTARQGQNLRQATLPTLGWKLVDLEQTGLRFQLTAGGQAAGQLRIGWSGWTVDLHGLGMEARDITPLLPGLLNKGDWRGSLNVQNVAAHGDWRIARLSQIDLLWSNAGTGLMPNGELGSFVLKAHSEQVGVSFSINSQDGPLVISGRGRHSAQQGFQFSGQLTDNAGLASQFPGFLSAYLQPTGEPRRYTVQVTQLDL